MTDLPTLPGATRINVTGMNNSGQVVGYSDAADGNIHAVIWQNGAISMLPVEPGETGSIACGINASGQIDGAVGNNVNTMHAALWDGSAVAHAIIYQNGALTDLGSAPNGPGGFATAINDLGEAIGVATSMVCMLSCGKTAK